MNTESSILQHNSPPDPIKKGIHDDDFVYTKTGVLDVVKAGGVRVLRDIRRLCLTMNAIEIMRSESSNFNHNTIFRHDDITKKKVEFLLQKEINQGRWDSASQVIRASINMLFRKELDHYELLK